MVRDQRSSGLPEDLEDCPFDPYVRIAPLQDPIPVTNTTRPPPLEPNTRVNLNSSITNANLKTRLKALAEALPIGEPEIDNTCNAYSLDEGQHMVNMSMERQHKRQRLSNRGRVGDFVQLPKPSAKTKVDKPPPFQPVSVLNELHSPPPSAALFPPITAGTDEDHSDYNQNYPLARGPNDRVAKRMNLRPRLKWTECETKDLLTGVELFGMGKWKKILSHQAFKFSRERTAVDLKDRYRTCRANGLSLESSDLIFAADHQAAEGICPDDNGELPRPSFTQVELSLESRPKPSIGGSFEENARHGTDPASTNLSQLEYVPSLKISTQTPTTTMTTTTPAANGFTAVNTRHSISKPRPKRKFSSTYSPVEIRKRKPKNHWTEAEDKYLAEGYRKHGFQWTLIARDPDLVLSHRTGPQIRDRFRLKYRDLYLSDVALPLPDDTKPKPTSPDSIPPDSSITELSHKIYVAQIAPLPVPTEGFDPNESSDEEEISDNSENEEQSRQSSVAADESEARHLGILGLLNDEEGEVSKLPSFKYTYDEWEGDSLTLPPLLWEEMATRPIFDLE